MKKIYIIVFLLVFSSSARAYNSGTRILEDVVSTILTEAIKSSGRNTPSPSSTETHSSEAPSLRAKSYKLAGALHELADDFINEHSPSFDAEVQASSYGIPEKDPTVWTRGWASGGTIATASAGEDMNFTPRSVTTTEGRFVFAGSIRAGGSIRDLETYFDATLTEIRQSLSSSTGAGQDTKGYISLPGHGSFELVYIHYNDKGIITELAWADLKRPVADETLIFIRKARRELGLPDYPENELLY